MSLSRSEAQRRAALLEIHSYQIDLDLTDGHGAPGSGTFRTTTVVRFGCHSPGASSRIDLIADRVRHAILDGAPLTTGVRAAGIDLPLLSAENELVVEADCRYSTIGRGLHRGVDPIDGVYLHTQFQTNFAHQVFACFDQPDLKARFQLRVTAPASWTVVSNTAVIVREPVGTAVRWTFAVTEPLATYLVGFVAGDYRHWHGTFQGSARSIPLGLYCRPSLAEHFDPDRLLNETRQGLAHFERAFGTPYPFGKYDQCFVPEFHAAAMEHAGCVTASESLVFRGHPGQASLQRRCGILLHEMAHMWFGNLVTMRWWDDLWLSESFATWAGVAAAASATEYSEAWAAFSNTEKTWAYTQDRLPSTHPVIADIPDVRAIELNFDGITYAKGAALVRQLMAYVGQDAFRSAVASFLSRHAFGNATLTDLLNALADASGHDLSAWAEQWLHTTGVNTLEPTFHVDRHGHFTDFALVQRPAHPGAGELRTHRVAIGVYDDDGSRLVRRHRIEVTVCGAVSPVDALIGLPRGQLVIINDDDLAYALTRLDPDSLTTVRRRIGEIDATLPRALCWSTLWEMTGEAELGAWEFLTTLLDGLPGERDLGVVTRLLAQANSAICRYVAPEHASAAWQALTDRLMELATAEPDPDTGSERQGVYLNAMTSCALDTKGLQLLRECLDGALSLPGPPIGADLRWRLLQALVAHGAADRADIEAELTRDQSARGMAAATTARAAIPEADRKFEVWRQILADDIPPAAREQLMAGFAHPSQRDLLLGYSRRYVTALDDVDQRWTPVEAHHFASRMFPHWASVEDTERAVGQWLRTRPSGPLHRIVTEHQAELRRAIAAQEHDRACRSVRR